MPDVDTRLSQLIDDAYAAAIEPSRWSGWAWQINDLLGGNCCSLNIVEQSGRIDHQTIRHKDMNVVERYLADGIGRFDPQVPHANSLKTACVYADVDHLDPEDPGTATYLAWQRANGDLRHYLTALAPLPGGGKVAGLSIHYAATDGPASSRDRAVMAALLPHFARAATLGFHHAEKLTEAYWDGLLQHRDEPCLLVAEDGRILRTAGELDGLLAADDGLGCRDGRLVATGEGVDGGLKKLLAGVGTARPRPGSCRVQRPSGRSPYVITSHPLPRSARFLAPFEAAALITIVDPVARPAFTSTRWVDAFAFSPRECELAELLLLDHSIGSAARNLRISDATARVHLKSLFAKARVNRQSSLVRLLSRCR